MRVITDLLPSVFAVTASYTFKNSHLRFNCNLAVSRNKILCNVFSTCYTHHTDLIIIVYGVFDWTISRAIFHFIIFCFCRLIFENAPIQIRIALYQVIIFLTFRFSQVAFAVAITVKN